MAYRDFVTNDITMVVDSIDRARKMNRISPYRHQIERESVIYVYSETGIIPPHSPEYLEEYQASMNQKHSDKASCELPVGGSHLNGPTLGTDLY